MSTFGFIGLGNMGAHMARNLVRNGFKLMVCDMDAEKVAQLKTTRAGVVCNQESNVPIPFSYFQHGTKLNTHAMSDGAETAKRPADVASECNRIVTMLPNSAVVKNVFTADDGILRTMKQGTLCIDSSTIDQSVTLEVAKLVNAKHGHYVDAPVSGGVVGAQNATLTFMVGGDDASFKSACELLKVMGKNIVHCGKVGSGQATKICNNMLLGIQMIGVAEAMNLGIKLGLDAKQLAAIINTSSGRCWSSDTYNPVPGIIEGIPPSKGYAGGFGCALMSKDLGLAQNASTAAQVSTPLGALANQIYETLAKSPEYKTLDFGAVYQFLKNHSIK